MVVGDHRAGAPIGGGAASGIIAVAARTQAATTDRGKPVALGVTLDYLVKDGEYDHIDKDTLNRLREVQRLDPENRAHVFATIDAFIKAAKLKSIAAL